MLGKLPSSTSISEIYISALAFFFECETACLLWGGSAQKRKDERKDTINVFKYLEGRDVEKGGEFVLCSPRRQHQKQGAAGGGIFSLQWNNWFPFMEKLPKPSRV